jgi:hypothetical protein
MIILSDLSTVEEYASMCGVAIQTIYHRHKQGSLASIEIDGYVFIDSKASPPKKFFSRFRAKPLKPKLLPDDLDINDLILVRKYALKKYVRPDIYYGMAMMGKIQSVVAGNAVFILKKEANTIPTKRKHLGR